MGSGVGTAGQALGGAAAGAILMTPGDSTGPMNARPEARLPPLEERAWSRHCEGSTDPCGSLKVAVQAAIAMAQLKINAMLTDRGGMFGTAGRMQRT